MVGPFFSFMHMELRVRQGDVMVRPCFVSATVSITLPYPYL